MADELNKKNPNFDSGSSSESAPKPKTIGTPAPNVPKLKQTPTTKPQLTPKSSMPKKMTVKSGNPNLGESAPVGIQRKRFESDKHANKRLNKMFDETKAATLGVWNHDNTHPMGKPNSVKFNPNLEYKPSQEQLKQARQKIMAQGFRPKSDQEANKLLEEAQSPAPAPKKKWYVNTLNNEDLSGDDFIEADTEEEAFKEAERRYPGHGDELNVYTDEKSEEPKASKFDYDSISKELDSGEMVNIDAGLLPYEHGFETNGNEDLAVDARKNPEGKYELFMYPETENGPVNEPDENEPDYVFDSFDEMKAFIENGYKKVEKPAWDPADEPGSGVVSKKLTDFVREYLTKQVGKEFADITANKLSQNANMADGYKRIMKKELGGGDQ